MANALGSAARALLGGVASAIKTHANDNYVPAPNDIGSAHLALAGMEAKTPFAVANDNIKAVSGGRGPTLSASVRVTKIDSGDVFKALQQVANENVKATNIVQKDLANIYSFLNKQTDRALQAADIVGRQVQNLDRRQRSIDDEVKRLRYQIQNMSFGNRGVSYGGLPTPTSAPNNAANDNASGGLGVTDIVAGGAAANALKSRFKLGSTLKSGLRAGLKGGLVGGAALIGGEYAMDKLMGTPDDQYATNLPKYGKAKADELRRVQTEGSWDRLKRVATDILPNNVTSGRTPEAEVTQDGQEKPGFFRRMLQQLNAAGSQGVSGGNALATMSGGGTGGSTASFNERFQSSPSTFKAPTATTENRGAFKPVAGSTGSYPRMAEIKASMVNQALSHGLSQSQAERLANSLGGQAISESGLKSQYHDAGKSLGSAGGYVPSIYGADRERGQAMHSWLKSKGMDPNDTAHQGAWMVNEYMTNPRFKGIAERARNDKLSDFDISQDGTVKYEAPKTKDTAYTQQERYANMQKFAGIKLEDSTKTSAPSTTTTTTAGTPAVPGTFKASGLASWAISDGKLSEYGTNRMRNEGFIKSLGSSFDKLPPDVQNHLKNSKQIDMNMMAQHAHMLPADVRKSMSDNGLTFTDARPAIPGTTTTSPIAGATAAMPVQPQGLDNKVPQASKVHEHQQQVAGTRKGEIQGTLKQQLDYAANRIGAEVEVYSGGQRMHGAPGAVGSHRHDDGGAADFKLFEMVDGKKRYLDSKNPADKARMAQFVSSSVQAGATGVGHGEGYMGSQSLHVGGGSHASWGGADWIEDARVAGMNSRKDFDPNNLQRVDAAVRLSDAERAVMTEKASANPNWVGTVSKDGTPAAEKPASFDDRFGSWDPGTTKAALGGDGIPPDTSGGQGFSNKVAAPGSGVEPDRSGGQTPVQPDIQPAAIDYAPTQPQVALPTGGVGATDGWKPLESQTAKDSSVFDKGAAPIKNTEGGSSGRGNRGESGGLRSPTNNPEQSNPTPGNNGYGEQSSPDGVGLCSV